MCRHSEDMQSAAGGVCAIPIAILCGFCARVCEGEGGEREPSHVTFAFSLYVRGQKAASCTKRGLSMQGVKIYQAATVAEAASMDSSGTHSVSAAQGPPHIRTRHSIPLESNSGSIVHLWLGSCYERHKR